MKVAIVDDEADLRETIHFAFKREGYDVDEYADGLEAWSRFQNRLPDLIVLDVMMPGMDGLELCRRVRTLSQSVPILFLSSRDEEIDRILGLEIGGDDYMCKPFSLRELVVRTKVLFRRQRAREMDAGNSQTHTAGFLTLDLDKYAVYWHGIRIELTVTEFLLLKMLVMNPGVVKTREVLIDLVYPVGTYISARTIDTHIKRLRKKFEKVDPEFNEIETVHGLGYRYKEVLSEHSV